MFDNCDIGRRARVRRAILDKNVRVPEDATIGFDLEQDRELYHVTESGIVVVEGHRSTVDVATMLVVRQYTVAELFDCRVRSM